MTATITTYRQNVAATLAGAFGFSFVAGRIDGPIERGNLGCCWVERKREDDEDVMIERVILYARALLAGTSRSTSPHSPFDPTQLETWAELFQTTLDDVQDTLEPVDYLRVTEVEINIDSRQVTAEVHAWQRNVFETGA